MQLTDNVYVETGFEGANVGCVTTDEGLVLTDTPAKPTNAIAWLREIEAKGAVKYLVNMEPHDDHYAGGFFFNVPAIAHKTTREIMLSADVNQIKEVLIAIDPDGASLLGDYRLNVPVITFSERLTMYLGKHTLHFIFLPGHTAGQIALYIPEEKVVFTGDNVTYKIRGFLHDADPFAWLESLKRIGELEVDYIIPGHGGVCDKSYLKEQEKYVRDCTDAVKNSIDRGWTKDEAVARVEWPSYFPIDDGTDEIAPRLFQMSVARLYDVLSVK